MDTREAKIYITILIALAVFIILVIFFVANIIKHQRAKIAIQNQKVRNEISFLDKERKRIAIDLHDGLGASISSVKLLLQCLEGLDDTNLAIIEKSEKRIDHVMESLRRISFNMMPGALQRRGLDEALRELISMVITSSGIKVQYEYNSGPVSQDKAIHIYRISQEILNNILKHAVAKNIRFSFTTIKSKMVLSIADDGIGFYKNAVMQTGESLGMQSIASRADVLNAEIILDSLPGKGTRYQIEIPL